MSFVDTVSESKIPGIIESTEDIMGCVQSSYGSSFLLAVLFIYYLYTCLLAYQASYQNGRMLRNILVSVFYVPLSILRTLRCFYRAVVFYILFHRFFSLDSSEAQAPSSVVQNNNMTHHPEDVDRIAEEYFQHYDEDNSEQYELSEIIIHTDSFQPNGAVV